MDGNKLRIGSRSDEIGSYFDISPCCIASSADDAVLNVFDDAVLFSTCRSVIDAILKHIAGRKGVALLPGFTCHAVVYPFVKNGYQVLPYSVRTDLKIDMDDLCEKVYRYHPDIVLIHDYFGFDSNERLRENDLLNEFRQNGIMVINDRTQSMFSSYETLPCDYQVGSIRKWLGIPDGAFLRGNLSVCVSETDRDLETAKVEAMIAKYGYLFDKVGSKTDVLANYKKAEGILDSRERLYAISETSRILLGISSVSKIRETRQNNARMLVSTFLGNENVELPFECIHENEVPFYVPIEVKKDRKKFQGYLAKNNVFTTIIWGCPTELCKYVSAETKQIYDEILCVPCDQRYCISDMEHIAEIVGSYVW